MDIMTIPDINNLIESTTGIPRTMQWDIAISALIIIALWLLQRGAKVIINRRTEDPRVTYRWRKLIEYSSFVLGLFIVGRIWFDGLGAIATFLGLLGAGLAIALKDPLVNLAGWTFIMFRRPFDVGDRIQIGDRIGDIVDQQIFTFSMMEVGHWCGAEQSTGRLLIMPNGSVFSQPLANYFKGFELIWAELPVLVTFESNWRKAKKILEEIINEHSTPVVEKAKSRMPKVRRKTMIVFNNLTPTVYTSVQDSGVLLTMRALSEPRGRRGYEEKIWESVLDAFAEHDDIDFAYPTQRMYHNMIEGKASAITHHPLNVSTSGR